MTEYLMGVDLGTTYSAAAIATEGRVVSVGLGNQSHVIPSVVALDDGGEVIVGESASRQSRMEPGAAAREFKRRFGDTTPYLLRGTPFSPEALTGRLLEWIVDRVSEIEGGTPSGLRLTHPANWGPYQIDLLGEAARLVDLGPVSFMTEPEAAAVHYATQQRIPDGAIVAVYDLGGGTFDASVLRREGDSFRTLGRPEGIARLGGIDFDEAVFGHVTRSLGDVWNSIDAQDPATVTALARLRRDCVAAKEDLSSRTTTSVEVLLPGHTSEVRLTRAEFEGLITMPIEQTIGALQRALQSAEVEPGDIHNVLLVGGSSRVPLVAQMVSSQLERPVAVDAHPKYAVSMGAAIALEAERTGPATAPPVLEVAPVEEAPPADLLDTNEHEALRVPLGTATDQEAQQAPTNEQTAQQAPTNEQEALRVPLPVTEAVAAVTAQQPVVAPPTPAPAEPAVPATAPRPRRVFPTTKQATVLLVLGVVALLAGVAWLFLGDPGRRSVGADEISHPDAAVHALHST